MDNLENVEDLAHMFNFDQQIPTMDNWNDGCFTGVIEELLADKKQAIEKANSYQETVKKLIHLLGIAYKERDEANDKLRKLLLVKPYSPFSCKSQATTSHTQPPNPNLTCSMGQGASTSDARNFTPDRNMDLQTMYNVGPMIEASDNNAFATLADPFIDVDSRFYMGSIDSMHNASSYLDSVNTSTLYDNIPIQRALPNKGKLLESVQEAGPLLETIMVAASTSSQWQNPPQASQFLREAPMSFAMNHKRPRNT